MPRIARSKVKGEPAVYHVISRTALEGFVLGDDEKEYECGKGVGRRAQGVRGEKKKGMRREVSGVDTFRYRCRYFTDSGIIGTRDFVGRVYRPFNNYFASKHEKRPKVIAGLKGAFSLKRLSEVI
jgi:hypothetical protein